MFKEYVFKECVSIWGNKPKKKGRDMEKQQEFPFVEKTREQEMKEISADATRQLKATLDEIIKKGDYSIDDFMNIVNQASWIERS